MKFKKNRENYTKITRDKFDSYLLCCLAGGFPPRLALDPALPLADKLLEEATRRLLLLYPPRFEAPPLLCPEEPPRPPREPSPTRLFMLEPRLDVSSL